MDILTYSYQTNSNKLLKVADAAPVDKYGFTDDAVNMAADTANDYTYDANGNMLTDTNKGITSNILYNHLNLPTQVTLGLGNIQYIYDATGVKQKKIVSTGTTTEYAGNYIYEKTTVGEQLKFFNQPEGYVEPDGSGGFDYVYQYKDHLNNVRLTYADDNNDGSIETSTEIRREQNYYPGGLEHKGYNNVVSANANSSADKYKFNGKELNDELGLDWYDFGARNYDASLMRWMNVDPLAETSRRFSPYTYALNNPIYFIDPDGMEAVSPQFNPDDLEKANINSGNESFVDAWKNNGDGTWTAVAGDSAWSLSKDARITPELANSIVEGQLGKNYKGADGGLKSDVEVGDKVTISSADTKDDSTIATSEAGPNENTNSSGGRLSKSDALGLWGTGDDDMSNNSRGSSGNNMGGLDVATNAWTTLMMKAIDNGNFGGTPITINTLSSEDNFAVINYASNSSGKDNVIWINGAKTRRQVDSIIQSNPKTSLGKRQNGRSSNRNFYSDSSQVIKVRNN